MEVKHLRVIEINLCDSDLQLIIFRYLIEVRKILSSKDAASIEFFSEGLLNKLISVNCVIKSARSLDFLGQDELSS